MVIVRVFDVLLLNYLTCDFKCVASPHLIHGVGVSAVLDV